MSYENPPVPHEVNVSRESVLAEFLRLSLGLVVCVVLLSAFLFLAGGWLARFIPYSVESEWIGQRVIGVSLLDEKAKRDAGESAAIRAYLQTLLGRLSSRMELPPGMRLTVHLSESDVPNAFATLGGHVVVTRGLYRRMPSENALALVLAHEISHIKSRDPISAIGGSASLAVLLVLIGGEADVLAPHIAGLVQRGYSRRAESRADAEAVAALRTVYGHARGASAVFEALADYQLGTLGRVKVPTLLSTHPPDSERIKRMTEAGHDRDSRAALVPLAIIARARPITPDSSASETGECKPRE